MKRPVHIQARMGRLLLWLLSVGIGVAAGAPGPLEKARALYNRAEYEAALEILEQIPRKGAREYLLMGQCHYMQGDAKKASETFQKAVDRDPGNAENWLWLGRAYGRRAETSSFVTAPSYATKARRYFEKAVELDPNNPEALSDLFEYYLEAPGVLGGGLDKAAKLAERIGRNDPAEYHWAQSRLAEKRKEYHRAEEQLRRAVELAPRQVGRLIDLAKFLAQTGRYEESDELFRKARQLAPDAPKVLFAQASALIRAKRNLEVARELLKRYLASPLTPDDPPRWEAERLLKSAS
ncbi:MAG TPA: tetratricopeptide repeat protein [Bryobacteraceae bacterium]|nr:tetratricopeptide repeat protein [Bryobacteraceae bacterium]